MCPIFPPDFCFFQCGGWPANRSYGRFPTSWDDGWQTLSPPPVGVVMITAWHTGSLPLWCSMVPPGKEGPDGHPFPPRHSLAPLPTVANDPLVVRLDSMREQSPSPDPGTPPLPPPPAPAPGPSPDRRWLIPVTLWLSLRSPPVGRRVGSGGGEMKKWCAFC